jgi:DNA modification methylase
MTVRLLAGDAAEVLATLPASSAHACICSPPFFGLRDYKTGRWEGGDPACAHDNGGQRQVPQTKHPSAASAIVAGGNRGGGGQCVRCGAVRHDQQIGLEATPADYAARLVAIFAEVKRVLRPDGLLWVELGDSYGHGAMSRRQPSRTSTKVSPGQHEAQGGRHGGMAKQLLGIPWRVAFALQDTGWVLRSEIIWHRPNPMPESVQDRVTRSHSTIFMFAQQSRYYYDATAVQEPAMQAGRVRADRMGEKKYGAGTKHSDGAIFTGAETRNRRSVWTVATQPYSSGREVDHFAAWPEQLVEPMILASTSAKGACPACGAAWRRVVEHGWQPSCRCGHAETVPCVVLDCFAGTGTTLRVATAHGRDAVGIDLNPAYAVLQEDRLTGIQTSFASLLNEGGADGE